MIKQWYEQNPKLYQREIELLKPLLHGNEHYFFCEEGTNNLCLYVKFQPFTGRGDYSEYEVMLMYLPNHPSKEYGFSGSIRVYPVGRFGQSIKYLLEKGFRIPHLIYDADRGMHYLCTANTESFKTGKKKTTGNVVLKIALTYIYLFHKTVIEGSISFDDWKHDLSITL